MLLEQNKELGNRIKHIRLKLGKSQEEFGQLFDPPAPKSAVSRWEHGGSPNKKRLKIIAKLGNISVDDLVNGSLKEAISNILDDAYQLYYEFLNITSDSTWESFVSSASNHEEKMKYRNYASMFSLIEYDNYVPFPITAKNRDKLSQKEKDELINNYHHDNVIEAFRYCAREALKKAEEANVKPTATVLLTRLIAESAEQHFNNEMPNNIGVINITNNGLDDIRNKLYGLIHGLDTSKMSDSNTTPEVVTYANDIDEDLYRDVNCIIDNAQNALGELSKKYNINLD